MVVGKPFEKNDPRINRKGRPKGKSLKEYWRQRFADMTDEQKEEFAKKVNPELLWQMAEGRPQQDNSIKGDKENPIAIQISSEIADKNDITSKTKPNSE